MCVNCDQVVDPNEWSHYIYCMDMKKLVLTEEVKMQNLEQSLDELFRVYAQLRVENDQLREKFAKVSTEHVHMKKINDTSKQKMEAMIQRLKSLELDL